MKKYVCLVILMLLTSSSSVSAQPYLGLRLGTGRVGNDGESNGLRSGPETLGFVVGYRAGQYRDWLVAVEGVGDFSISRADAELGERWDVDSGALYLAGRAGSELYVKAKFGMIFERLSITGSPGTSESDLGGSIGGGLGVQLPGAFAFEMEVTLLEESLALLSVAAIRQF